MQCLHNALIRTHHITSRKKVAKLKQAATFHDVFVLLRYGGAPGVMYVEGKADGVNQWVSDVQVGQTQLYTKLCQSELTAMPEPAVQRLPARLSHRRRASREHSRRRANEARRPVRKRHSQGLWQSDAAARCVCMVEECHGVHGFVRQNMRTSVCAKHLIAPHRALMRAPREGQRGLFPSRSVQSRENCYDQSDHRQQTVTSHAYHK